MNAELDEDCTMSEWEAMLELDEALAGWLLQGPARGEWGWEWGWAASDLQDPEWDTEDIPAVSRPPLVNNKQSKRRGIEIFCFYHFNSNKISHERERVN